jgi:hypothetical protein
MAVLTVFMFTSGATVGRRMAIPAKFPYMMVKAG